MFLLQVIGETFAYDPDILIHHYSCCSQTEIEKSLQVRLLNFAVPPKKLKYESYINHLIHHLGI